MKKIYLLTALALAMAACSTSEQQEVITGESLPSIEQGLKLNIVSATPTRADAIYEDGSPTENKVDRVRFYFFDQNGNVAPAWENKGTGNNNYNSFIDWFPSTSDQTPDTDKTQGTVEKVLSVTLSLSFPANLEEVQPAAVLAVLNPPQEVLNLTDSHTVQAGASQITVNGPDLSTLKTTYSNYLTRMTTAGTFVMSNSVYAENGEEVVATIITKDNWEPDKEDAEQTPITIYVERVLARVDFSLNLNSSTDSPENPSITLENGKTIYKVGSYSINDGNDSPVDTDIYIDLLGWNVTGTTSASRLVKMINPSWTDADVFGTIEGSAVQPWNIPSYRRSFWAVNPPQDNFKYQYGNFNSEGDDSGLSATAQKMPSGTIYLQENANTYNTNGTYGGVAPEAPAYATNLIIAAQLVDSQGQPYPMAEWNNYRYTLPQMKLKIASVLSNLYKRTTNAQNETVYTSISSDDFTFATAEDLNIQEDNEAGYYVYPVLTEDAQEYTWTLGEGTDASPMTSYQKVNTYMRDMVNHVMVWGDETNPGYTYYFVTIRHLGEEEFPGYWGVVRNHIYRVSIKSIAGLGTPVYNPEETIYPEEVQSGNNVITAKIDILQWRVVNQPFGITWP